MSESIPVPRGKKRREVIPPSTEPVLDTAGLVRLQDWRSTTYKQPILDDLLGYYRFDPPTKLGADVYTGARNKILGVEGMAREIVRRYVERPANVEAEELRQIIHRAETTELATALFWSVAVLRSTVLDEALARVARNEPMDEDVAVYAADAVVDMGLCIEAPYENNWKLRAHARQRKYPQGLGVKIEQIAPGIGTNVVDFGAYAGEHPEAFYSEAGLTVLHAARTEQDYRIETWAPRHAAVTEAFPDLPLSKEILYMSLPLSEMLSIRDNLPEEKEAC